MSKEDTADVFLVEDNPGDVQLTRIAFEESGLRVRLTVARTAAEARSILTRAQTQRRRYDLILLDLNLTDASGHDLLAWCKRQPRLADVPVVVVSTSDYYRDRQRAAELGSIGYIVKPNSFMDFVDMLAGLEPLLFQQSSG
ncbi:hypothetical protein CAI21_05685 [Alkalilimnicola ehrlichii]|uniref:Response regulatory domain-containing protein n=1 Tax=Alkalilimnicola ehrlichii TaxID=351052 RepID=A0A3E0WYL4_9GAMM|nr:response regulator [Alkalilimnicola ehrlichii]RFA30537.1 hypothetical protein CAI21_05685 [Alkalilimnicola ehrlichii]RFA38084.1 hypothetical protein CAL65_07055 [Alkalilimnicola ehrlichii]